MFPVELLDRGLSNEELRAVGAGAGVCHSEAAGFVEGECGVELVLKEVAWVTGAVSSLVASLNHEARDDAVKGGSVIEGLTVDLLERAGIGPVFGAFGETNEVGNGDWRLRLIELAGKPAHCGVEDGGGPCGHDWGLGLTGRAGRVRKCLG